MKYILLLILSMPASALTLSESSDIDRFSLLTGKVLVSADACLTELLLTDKQGINCKDFDSRMIKVSKLYRKIMQIKPDNKRHLAIAGNNTWYAAFNVYDSVLYIENQINKQINQGEVK